jgi:hypothetical protein
VAVTVTGEVRWCDWKSGVRSGFFSDLWAQLFGERTAEPAISIEVRDFDRAAGLQPAGRIFTAGKGDYHDIADGLPTASRDRGHFA